MSHIIHIGGRRELLLTPQMVMDMTGLGRDSAMQLFRLEGYRIGRRWYMTADQLTEAQRKLRQMTEKQLGGYGQ